MKKVPISTLRTALRTNHAAVSSGGRSRGWYSVIEGIPSSSGGRVANESTARAARKRAGAWGRARARAPRRRIGRLGVCLGVWAFGPR
eukprot:CAMPEP_0184386186 /NCGR_PEP_ID=MMETSP0007-20130409/9563_1 /TAXON_ID=97485 /ORGANISM="Prymnesium parvum, Strain Texoma1" /LENGTH=87 /DNA_ID=CAMNT_0026733925 /DNA_START=111 /DNA_END=374 /DNA_ORIENTATION=-